MQEEQRILLEHLANALFQVPTSAPVTDGVIKEAIQQSVLTLLPVEDHKLYLPMMANNAQVEWAHQHVHALMQANNIPYAIMKGIVSASYYPDPTRRPLGDVDFLVREEDLPRARKALEEGGFTATGEENEYHVGYHAGKRTVELHRLAPGAPQDHAISRYFADMVDKAEDKDGCMCTSAFHHGLLLLTHSSKHLLSTGIGLRHLCDWAVFYASFSAQDFVGMFETVLKEVGLWKYAQILSRVCVRYLGAPQQAWMGDVSPKLLDDLMEDIFAGGSFGWKDRERYNQAQIMGETDLCDAGETGAVQRLLMGLVHRAYRAWPVCGKCKLLLPLAMVCVGVRHLLLIAQGKRRSIHFGKAVGGAQKRMELYRQFELYKQE